MAISGLIAGGVQSALDDVQDRRLKELLRQMQEQQQADSLALQTRQMEGIEADRAAGREAQARTIDLNELKRRDDNNTQGLNLMRQDKQQMDLDSAVEGLPAHLKPLGGLFRVGALGKLSPEDMQSPEDRATAAKAAEEREIRVRRASIAPREPRERKQQWVFRGDSTTPTPIDEGTAQPGDRPYDPVAARSSQPNNPEAVDTAREAKRLATELVGHKGFGGAFGLADSYIPTMRQTTADAETLRDALTSLLTLENMNKMKGVLSDSDMKLLKQASSTINARMSEGAARTELRRIARVMSKVTGDGDPFPEDDQQQQAPAVDPRVQAMIDKYGKPPK